MLLMAEGMVLFDMTVSGPVGAPQEAQRYLMSRKKVPVAYPQLAQALSKPWLLVKWVRPP